MAGGNSTGKRLFSLWDKARSDPRGVRGIKLNHYSLRGLDYRFRLPENLLVLSVHANRNLLLFTATSIEFGTNEKLK